MLCLFAVKDNLVFFIHCIYLLLIDAALSKVVFKTGTYTFK